MSAFKRSLILTSGYVSVEGSFIKVQILRDAGAYDKTRGGRTVCGVCHSYCAILSFARHFRADGEQEVVTDLCSCVAQRLGVFGLYEAAAALSLVDLTKLWSLSCFVFLSEVEAVVLGYV